ncbi:MAG: DUF2779 domain-containing protein [Bacteroidota bacterium]
MPTISKSHFVSGIQCEKKLYFDVYRKDLKPSENKESQRLFSNGNNVGKLAQKAFPHGKDATIEMNNDWSKAIHFTKRWLKEGLNTIYEATFSHSRVFAALDILHHTENERWAIEVKSSTDVKDYHINDASIQYWVMNKSGFPPDRFFIMHINSDYIKNGPIDVNEIFTLTDISDLVITKQAWVSEQLNRLFDILDAKKEPFLEIGKHCKNPFLCDYKHHCWQHIPKQSVFELYSPRGKDWELYSNGILTLKDIPSTEILTHRQRLQVEGIKTNQSYFDKESISNFLNDIQFPIYFLDFETIFPVIPVLDGAHPYQQIPFQYSLHIVNNIDGDIEHKEFLADPIHFQDNSPIDPRLELLIQLKKDIGQYGSIVAYNASFEINVLKSLAPIFPAYQCFIDDLCTRFIDLLIPFKQAWYYIPSFGNSASIKSVLPALSADFSYDDLVIGNGSDASETFLSMINNTFEGDSGATNENLLKYCERDTYGMVIIWKHLIEKISHL